MNTGISTRTTRRASQVAVGSMPRSFGVVLGCFALMLSAPVLAAEAHHKSASDHGDKHHPAGFSYTFGEVRYVSTEVEDHGVDVDGDGFKVEGAIGLGDHFHFFGGYRDLDLDHDISATEAELGFGTQFTVASGLDVFGRIGYVDEEVDHHEDDGYVFALGFRKRVGSGGELFGVAKHLELDEVSDQFYEFGGEIHVTSSLALSAAVELSDETTSYLLGARVYFGGH